MKDLLIWLSIFLIVLGIIKGTIDIPFLNTAVIAEEEKYDGFYAVCTNLD